jgi:acetyl-CoA hydrolase
MSGAAMASAALKARVRRPALLNKLTKAEDLIHHFPNGAYIGWSGFTGVGYPKLSEWRFLPGVEANWGC